MSDEPQNTPPKKYGKRTPPKFRAATSPSLGAVRARAARALRTLSQNTKLVEFPENKSIVRVMLPVEDGGGVVIVRRTPAEARGANGAVFTIMVEASEGHSVQTFVGRVYLDDPRGRKIANVRSDTGLLRVVKNPEVKDQTP